MTDTVEAAKIVQPLELVHKALPTERGEYRRDHDLFNDGSFFRVNFHDLETNKVTRSYFVQVKNGRVIY